MNELTLHVQINPYIIAHPILSCLICLCDKCCVQLLWSASSAVNKCCCQWHLLLNIHTNGNNLFYVHLRSAICQLFISLCLTVQPRGGGGGGGGGTSYVRQYWMLGYTWVIFEKFSVLFSARWVPFFNKISVFFLQGGYLFWRKFLYLSNKMEPIYKKFSVFHSTKLLHFTHTISVYFYRMRIFSRDLL